MTPGDRRGVLILAHPYRFFANGRDATADALRDAVQTTEDDVYGIKPANGHRKLGEPIGGTASYDRIVEDRNGYGRLSRRNAAAVAAYAYARTGGFDRNECVGRATDSIRAAGGDVAVERELTASSTAVKLFFGDGLE
ncbi:MAG: hypothetical protein SVW77_00825 [Candidatus Nanohaloarchaea archaeon]|nr:hypothetical protein [Candidatus Nanohaloarchaea archaeon]